MQQADGVIANYETIAPPSIAPAPANGNALRAKRGLRQSALALLSGNEASAVTVDRVVGGEASKPKRKAAAASGDAGASKPAKKGKGGAAPAGGANPAAVASKRSRGRGKSQKAAEVTPATLKEQRRAELQREMDELENDSGNDNADDAC